VKVQKSDRDEQEAGSTRIQIDVLEQNHCSTRNFGKHWPYIGAKDNNDGDFGFSLLRRSLGFGAVTQ